MKKLTLLVCIFFLCISAEASASWAYRFVVYNHGTYEVTAEQVDSDRIGKKLGKVTRYTDREGTYGGNFSNVYPKGTTYHEIKGISPKEQIAVKTGIGAYIKAEYRGAYAGPAGGPSEVWLSIPIIVLLAAAAMFFYYRRRTRKRPT
ncbi:MULTISPECIES: hypothetical protein [Paenibacillus]|uniref:Uncharacterized protein n=1 Tax=Paenibacillus albilobatus TaxID=2716884 RepID=A0A919XJZ7_9BACL|nr:MULTISPECIES: hypothetical protein [Paenibacillus]GIO31653.1 hypothetical protein J2TS6_27940 [Paenibacillus albilobatus]